VSGSAVPGGGDAPPFGGSWKRLYGAVLALLALQIVLYDLLSRLFR
jgi:hypothetical protein